MFALRKRIQRRENGYVIQRPPNICVLLFFRELWEVARGRRRGAGDQLLQFAVNLTFSLYHCNRHTNYIFSVVHLDETTKKTRLKSKCKKHKVRWNHRHNMMVMMHIKNVVNIRQSAKLLWYMKSKALSDEISSGLYSLLTLTFVDFRLALWDPEAPLTLYKWHTT